MITYSEQQTLSARRYAAFVVIMLLALALRLPGCFSDFWLDEIWTLVTTKQFDSPADIFTEFLWDNNHPLNTFILYLLGGDHHWSIYRIHSEIAGLGVVLLSYLIGRRAGRLEAVFASLLTAVSYPMIHYSSEARGYAMVLFFAFGTFWAAQRFVGSRRWVWVVVIYFCACLGLMSHLIYVHALAALAVWLFVDLLRTCNTKRQAILRWAQCIVVPLVFLGAFYGLFIRNIKIIGGPPYKMIDILIRTLSYVGGGPERGIMSLVVSLLTVGLLLAAVIRLGRKRSSEWIFFLMAIFLPGVLVFVKRPEILFPRYFLISIAFGLLAVSYLLADLYRGGLVLRVCAAVITLLFLVGNCINTAGFYRYGRGRYLEMLRYMTDHTPEKVVVVAGDTPRQNRLRLKYYAQFLAPEKEIRMLGMENATEIPMWILLRHSADVSKIHTKVVVYHNIVYNLKKRSHYSGLSGFGWLLFQRQKATSTRH